MPCGKGNTLPLFTVTESSHFCLKSKKVQTILKTVLFRFNGHVLGVEDTKQSIKGEGY